MPTEQPVVYEIDATDRIVRVNPAWSASAQAGAVPGLHESQVVGRSLWDFVGDATTRRLYAAILERVRAGGRPLAFNFRCDTPTQRRLMRMRIAGRDARAVSFEVHLLATQDRPPVALLEATAPRHAGLLRMCSWCKRIPLTTGQWVEVEEAMNVLDILDSIPLPTITHGICPSCFETIMGALGGEPHGGDGDVTMGPLPPA
jgi:hypothetical protein